MLPRHWYPRLLVALWAGHIPIITWLSPDSLSGRALAASGLIGHLAMAALALMSALALVDVFINDLLPEGFHCAFMHHRHVGYMGMALALLLMAGVVGTRAGPSPILLSYMLPALAAVGVTWLDLFTRHQRAPA